MQRSRYDIRQGNVNKARARQFIIEFISRRTRQGQSRTFIICLIYVNNTATALASDGLLREFQSCTNIIETTPIDRHVTMRAASPRLTARHDYQTRLSFRTFIIPPRQQRLRSRYASSYQSRHVSPLLFSQRHTPARQLYGRAPFSEDTSSRLIRLNALIFSRRPHRQFMERSRHVSHYQNAARHYVMIIEACTRTAETMSYRMCVVTAALARAPLPPWSASSLNTVNSGQAEKAARAQQHVKMNNARCAIRRRQHCRVADDAASATRFRGRHTQRHAVRHAGLSVYRWLKAITAYVVVATLTNGNATHQQTHKAPVNRRDDSLPIRCRAWHIISRVFELSRRARKEHYH